MVALLVAGFAVAPLLRSPDQLAADAAPPPPGPITAAAEKRVLESVLFLPARAKAAKPGSLKLVEQGLDSGAVVTGSPLKAGELLLPGRRVLELNGAPVFALAWEFPPYRDLHPGDKGPDATQLQRSLQDAGYRISVTGTFDTQTADAVGRLYKANGYEAPRTPTPTAPAPEPVAGTPAEPGEPERAPAPEPTAVYFPAAAVLPVPAAGHRIETVKLRVGDKPGLDGSVLATVDAKPASLVGVLEGSVAASVTPGLKGTAVVAGGAGIPVEVASVGTELKEVDGLGLGYQVRFKTRGALGSGKYEIELPVTASGAAPVLAVPVTGVYAGAGGQSQVMVQRGEETSTVNVSIGVSVDGWVEVEPEGAGLAEGDLVVVGHQGG